VFLTQESLHTRPGGIIRFWKIAINRQGEMIDQPALVPIREQEAFGRFRRTMRLVTEQQEEGD
jgi:hypothetical protein